MSPLELEQIAEKLGAPIVKAPGPDVARHTPSLPVNFAYPHASCSAADSSALTLTKRNWFSTACGVRFCAFLLFSACWLGRIARPTMRIDCSTGSVSPSGFSRAGYANAGSRTSGEVLPHRSPRLQTSQFSACGQYPGEALFAPSHGPLRLSAVISCHSCRSPGRICPNRLTCVGGRPVTCSFS